MGKNKFNEKAIVGIYKAVFNADTVISYTSWITDVDNELPMMMPPDVQNTFRWICHDLEYNKETKYGEYLRIILGINKKDVKKLDIIDSVTYDKLINILKRDYKKLLMVGLKAIRCDEYKKLYNKSIKLKGYIESDMKKDFMSDRQYGDIITVFKTIPCSEILVCDIPNNFTIGKLLSSSHPKDELFKSNNIKDDNVVWMLNKLERVAIKYNDATDRFYISDLNRSIYNEIYDVIISYYHDKYLKHWAH